MGRILERIQVLEQTQFMITRSSRMNWVIFLLHTSIGGTVSCRLIQKGFYGGVIRRTSSDRMTLPYSLPAPFRIYRLVSFHDFADAWAHHFEDTNCVGGWVFKDADGLDANKNCLKHSEGGGLPRLSKVGPPDVIDLGSKDFFPGHLSERGGYANMQIAAAALWATREGIRSHMGPLLGPPRYFQSFVRALLSTGWLDIDDSNLDQDLYRGLLDLEVKLANEWVKSTSTGTESLLSKITAGFAKAGIFLIPPSCIDADPSTVVPVYCPASPGGENGGDAVIDIEEQ